MAKQHTEEKFEDFLVPYLVDNGWHQSDDKSYRRDLGVDPGEVAAFIQATQDENWQKLVDHCGSAEKAQQVFNKRLAEEVDARGTLNVLRKGIEVSLIPFDMSYPRPAHHITTEPWILYNENRTTVTRQVHQSETNTQDEVDLVLFLNGLPVATAELKNQLTGQGVKEAQRQYETDRNPNDLIFRSRALVHFAVDPYQVFLTTRLAGEDTYWLPFNQGSGGPGQIGDAGNPLNSGGHRTAYLWEEVWQRDNWIEVLLSFVHEKTEKKSNKGKAKARKVIFPRFHQWHAVTRMTAAAKAYGPGQDYLAQHSAGSGKSNTIAWLASALSTLHTGPVEADLGQGAKKVGLSTNQPIFNKVVIVTDRVVLDRQLQNTVTSFDHTPGIIQRIDQDSAQLRETLESAKARIIITTIQKFPVIAQAATEVHGSRFAVIIDEAHSGAAGESATDLKAVLGGLTGDKALEAAEAAEAEAEEATEDSQDKLQKQVQDRSKQPNLSFFAFTATPKKKTLDLFGTSYIGPEKGEIKRPFHVYSMRQAVAERFIMDVLKTYMTYSTYYRLANAKSDDPQLERGKAASALARFVSLHPTAFSQKAEIIVEHFRAHTVKQIGGRAKAMVVTRSRLHALRMKHALDEYIASKGYKGLSALVAFSGRVVDPDNPADPNDPEKGWTEPFINGFPEGQLPKKFNSDDYQVLVVAEKYQTGFDEPLLHTMYVDKKLTGVKAVQTLSRLNRVHPQKDSTFILDFVNTAEEMAEAFKPFWERTWAEPTDPNILSNLKTRLMSAGVLDVEEMTEFVDALLTHSGNTHATLYAMIDPAVERYTGLAEDDQEDFRTALRDFTRLYAFLAHIVPFNSVDLERLYLYGKALLMCLPATDTDDVVDLSGATRLTHLKFEPGVVDDASLSAVSEEETEVTGHVGGGRGKEHETPMERLSVIIHALNEQFGVGLTEEDQLFFEQTESAAMKDEKTIAVAVENDLIQFMTVFEKYLEDAMIDRHAANDALLTLFLDKPEFRKAFTSMIGPKVYEEIRKRNGVAGED